MRYLVATDSIHTTAAACDYLDSRLDPDDAVTVVTVLGSETRDGEDALNVANARLRGDATVGTERLESDGDPASAILAAADSGGSDLIIVGSTAGIPEAAPTLGSTARRVLDGADVPVVVVPLSL